MTYRDELGQAHRRIEHLENELHEAKVANEGGRPRPARGAVVVLIVLAATLSVAGALGVIVAMRSHANMAVPVASVDQVVRDPASYAGKTMRLQGELVLGTLVKQTEPCEFRFALERDHVRLMVRHPSCVLPDTFRDTSGLTIAAQGRLGANDVFDADAVYVQTPELRLMH